AAADNEVLGAAGDKDEPILVDATEIAADQPAILGAGILLVRVIEVACRLSRPLDLQHADLVGTAQPAPHTGAADGDGTDLCVGHAETRRAFLARTVARVDGDARRVLGHAIRVEYAHPGNLLKAALDRNRQRGRAGDEIRQQRGDTG